MEERCWKGTYFGGTVVIRLLALVGIFVLCFSLRRHVSKFEERKENNIRLTFYTVLNFSRWLDQIGSMAWRSTGDQGWVMTIYVSLMRLTSLLTVEVVAEHPARKHAPDTLNIKAQQLADYVERSIKNYICQKSGWENKGRKKKSYCCWTLRCKNWTMVGSDVTRTASGSAPKLVYASSKISRTQPLIRSPRETWQGGGGGTWVSLSAWHPNIKMWRYLLFGSQL